MSAGVGIEWSLFARQALVPFARRLGRGWWRAALRVLVADGRTILRDRMWPDECQLFGDRLDEVRAARRSLFLQADLGRTLRPVRAAIKRSGLASKLEFAAFCQRSGLPHVPSVKLCNRSGALAVPGSFGDHLFIKRDRGSSGRGAATLHRLPDGLWRRISAAGQMNGSFAEVLRPELTRGVLAGQPLLRNNDRIARLIGPNLITFRVITGHTAARGAAVLSVLSELPLDDLEPIAGRWLTVPVAIDTGQIAALSSAATAKLDTLALDRAERWSGRILEETSALVACAEAAHNAVVAASSAPLPQMIGWDIALTPDGPRLIELNWNWAVGPHYSNAAGFDLALSSVFASYAEPDRTAAPEARRVR